MSRTITVIVDTDIRTLEYILNRIGTILHEHIPNSAWKIITESEEA